MLCDPLDSPTGPLCTLPDSCCPSLLDDSLVYSPFALPLPSDLLFLRWLCLQASFLTTATEQYRPVLSVLYAHGTHPGLFSTLSCNATPEAMKWWGLPFLSFFFLECTKRSTEKRVHARVRCRRSFYEE